QVYILIRHQFNNVLTLFVQSFPITFAQQRRRTKNRWSSINFLFYVRTTFNQNMKFDDAITIKDIAKALNLSTSTVSRALRGRYEISAETKKLVMEYAERMN